MNSVSVVIPTWNRAATIKKAICSALAQTVPPLEILVCDDGSTDNTYQIVESIGDERVIWVPGSHSGRPAVPRNRGICESRGEWLAFLDSDDEWLPEKLEKQLSLAHQTGCKAVASNAKRFVPGSGLHGNLLSWGKELIRFDNLLRVNQVISSSALIHKSLFPKVVGFPEALQLKALEDYALWLRVATQTDFAYVAEPLLIYRDDPLNSVRSKSTDASSHYKDVSSDFISWAKTQDVPRSHMRKAQGRYANTFLHNKMTKSLAVVRHALPIGLLLAILPFLILSFFNHPSADDFSFSVKARELGFLKSQAVWYNEWTGRFFSTAILSVNPLVFESFWGYKFIPIVIIVLLFLSFMLIIKEFYLPVFSKNLLIITLLILVVYLAEMPSISQGIYWLAGAITYQLGNILMLLLFTLIIRLKKDYKTPQKILLLFLGSFLIFAVSGSNETAMLLILLLLGFISGFDIINKNISLSHIAFLILSLIACYIVASAPGNEVRLAYFPKSHNLWFSVKQSFLTAFKYVILWITTSPLLPSSILFLHIDSQINSRHTPKFNMHPFVLSTICLLLISLCFFPAYWSMGTNPPDRTINVIYLFFLIAWFLNLFLLANYFRRSKKMKIYPLSKCIYMFAFAAFFVIIYLKHDSNIRNAYIDLVSGTAYRYDKEQTSRYINIREDESDFCEVAPLVNHPKTLFVSDIDYEAKSWKNEPYGRYFNKEAIVLKKPVKHNLEVK